MAAQKGFIYEENAAAYLKLLKIVPEDFVPAGAGHDQPDLIIKRPYLDSEPAGCELKITSASAGSLVLKYNPIKKEWSFGKINRDEDEKMFIAQVAKDAKIFDKIAKKWTEVPYKIDREYQTTQWKNSVGKIPNKLRYERDHQVFKEINGELPSNTISKYYEKKKTYYMNVGTHGFFLLGNKNPLQLKGVPNFASAVKTKYRARVQYKGSGNYQFTFELSFSITGKSKYNIAPVDGKSLNIITNRVNIECFI